MVRPQSTLARSFSVSGAGLHTGRTATVTAEPAPPGSGIVFAFQAGGSTFRVRPDWRGRVPSRMNTALALAGDLRLRTVEHLMASLSGLRVDNVRIEVRGQELPILHGSAGPWCDLVLAAGIAGQDAPQRHLAIRRPVQVTDGVRFIRGEPFDRLALDVTTDQLPSFGALGWAGEITPATFAEELARARSFGSFGRLRTRGPIWRAAGRVGSGLRVALGLAGTRSAGAEPVGRRNLPCPDCPTAVPNHVGAALRPPRGEPHLRGVRPGRCAILVGGRIFGGARFPDEPVRHKALDLLGDLALAGAPLLGRVVAHRPTHALAYAFVATMMTGGYTSEIGGGESGRPEPAAAPRALAESDPDWHPSIRCSLPSSRSPCSSSPSSGRRWSAWPWESTTASAC